jgi:hypothetical protein
LANLRKIIEINDTAGPFPLKKITVPDGAPSLAATFLGFMRLFALGIAVETTPQRGNASRLKTMLRVSAGCWNE